MKCPFCKHPHDKVVDSRNSGDAIRRRRECANCAKRFTTYEYVQYASVIVVKRDGSREPFNREKLIRGLLNACVKRPVTLVEIEKAVSEIEEELSSQGDAEVKSDEIGSKILKKLKDIDQVAYIRFASVYQEFSNSEEFINVVREINQ